MNLTGQASSRHARLPKTHVSSVKQSWFHDGSCGGWDILQPSHRITSRAQMYSKLFVDVVPVYDPPPSGLSSIDGDGHAQSLGLVSGKRQTRSAPLIVRRRIAESNGLTSQLRTNSLYIGSVVNDSKAGSRS